VSHLFQSDECSNFSRRDAGAEFCRGHVVVAGGSTTLQHVAVLCELDASLPFLGRFMSPKLFRFDNI
jgi:hypothetical protein